MGALAIRSRWSTLALLVLSAAGAEPLAPAQTAAAGERLLHLKGSLFLISNNRLGGGFRGGH